MTSLPMFVQAVKKHFIAGPHRRGLVQHHHVEAPEDRMGVPKGFPDDPLQPVAADCGTTVFFGNCQTKPCFRPAVFFVKNRKHLIAATFCFLEDAAVRGRVKKPAAPSEAAVHHRACCWNVFRWIRNRGLLVLRREQRSSLRTPPFQHKAPGLCRHSSSKTMRTCPLQITGLECAFHVTDTCD